MPLFRRRPKGQPPAIDPDARSPETGLKYKDLALLGQMLQGGADLLQPRHALYYLYLPSREAAEAAGERAAAAGYRVDVRSPLPQQPDQWGVVCERDDAVLDVEGVNAADDLFQGIADALGGDFDGWEAALRP
jgi:hypothetical protein